jgi:hypothetical protein
MGEPLRVELAKGAFLNMAEERHDEIIAKMIKEGIIDENGNVLKRIPEPPEWLTGRNGHTSTIERPAKPAKKTKNPRKRN